MRHRCRVRFPSFLHICPLFGCGFGWGNPSRSPPFRSISAGRPAPALVHGLPLLAAPTAHVHKSALLPFVALVCPAVKGVADRLTVQSRRRAALRDLSPITSLVLPLLSLPFALVVVPFRPRVWHGRWESIVEERVRAPSINEKAKGVVKALSLTTGSVYALSNASLKDAPSWMRRHVCTRISCS